MSIRKAQSAMEYLMTYGWAILVVAIVLAALFELGVFSGSTLLGASCVAAPGFLCSSPLLSTNGQFAFNFGQNTGTTIYNIEMSCGATATSSGLPTNSASWSFIQASNGIATNSITTTNLNAAVDLPSASTVMVSQLVCYGTTGLPLSNQQIGTGFTGFIWLNYTLNACSMLPCNNIGGYQWYTYKVITLTTKTV